jgi:hypothetical protein
MSHQKAGKRSEKAKTQAQNRRSNFRTPKYGSGFEFEEGLSPIKVHKKIGNPGNVTKMQCMSKGHDS